MQCCGAPELRMPAQCLRAIRPTECVLPQLEMEEAFIR